MLDPHEQILAHCEMLHQCAAGLDGVLVVSVFYANPHGDADRPGTVTHHPVGDAERMADSIRAHLETPQANVYVGLQVMRRSLARGSRGGIADIVGVLGLVADMDADTGKATGTLPMPPSYSVETSPGNEQPVWLFDRPLSVDEARPLAAALRKATGSDAGTADVAHVFRVPGTLNWPNKAKIERGRSAEPVDVTIKQPFAGDLIDVETFRTSLAAYASATSSTTSVTAGEIPDSVDTTAELAAMLADSGQPDRSAHAARVIERLAFAGHTLEEAISLVVNCTGAWASRYRDAEHRRKDVERLWAKFGRTDRAEDAARGKEIADRLIANFMGAHDDLVPIAAPELDAPLIRATPFLWIDPTTLPRREFINGTHLIRKSLSVTVAPGGLGKSSLTIAEMLAMATGRPFFGGGLEPKRRVWMANLEDPRDELHRRIMAACIWYNIKPEQIYGNVFVDSGRDASMVVAIEERDGVKIVKPVVEAVIEAIKRNAIDVMIVDPFVSSHRVNENDNGAIDEVAKLWGKIAEECNIAIDMVHHVRKVSDREVTVDDARGAGALLNAARSARVLNRMTADEASAAGMTEEERFQFFSIQTGKANLAPTSSRRMWRKLESVAINNHGMTLADPGDHAGVVVPWEWPTIEAATAEVSADDLRRLKARVAGGNCRKDVQAKEWVGGAVAEVLGMDRKKDAPTIKRMLSAWMKDGDFIVEERRDGKGAMREYINVGDD